MTNDIEQKQTTKSEAMYDTIAKHYIAEHPTPMVSWNNTLYVYNGTHYVEEHQLNNRVRKFMRLHGYKQSNNIVGNVVPIVQNRAWKDEVEFKSMPFYVGDDSFPKNIIAYRNGLLDIDAFLNGSNDLIPHTPRWVSTMSLPYGFDPAATCPRWHSFLDEVFDCDTYRINLLQEWYGYCLTPDTSQHKLLMKIGKPRGGKGTTSHVLEELLGEGNHTGYTLWSLIERFQLRVLVNKYVAFVGEVHLANDPRKYRILEKLNSIVGGDAQAIETKNASEQPSVILPTRFDISCNEMPNFLDPSGALAARLLILNFDRDFTETMDKTLLQKLKGELSGIANWALEGYRRLKRQGTFTTSPKLKEQVNVFRRDSSNVFAFTQDCLAIERRIHPGNMPGVQVEDGELSIVGTQLQERYAKWCEENCKDYNGAWLERNLNSLLPKLHKERRTIDGVKRQVYFGIALASD